MFIEIENLTKTIKGVVILKDISVRFEGGKIYGLRGKNGSGKTMLMRAICGLIRPTNGTININNQFLAKDISFPPSVGVLIENPAFLSKYTGYGNLKILASIQNIITDSEIRQAISDVGLDPDDKRTYRKYSLGMKQRLGIACALMEHPDIVLLDEPINALDENGVLLIRKLLLKAKDRGAIVIVACHDKEELELLADEIYALSDGKIIDHTVLSKEEDYGHE
jgi:ABC-2 type transport system ATP-binding protein